MKKFLSIILFIAAFSGFLSAQQPTEAIDFTVTDIEGNEHHLFEYLDSGKYVYIQFFMINCPACVNSIPNVNNVYSSFGCNEFDLIVIAISQENTNDLVGFINEHEIIFPVVGNAGGGGPVLAAYNISAVPTYALIKPDHSITYLGPNVSEIASHGPGQSACPDEWPEADFSADPLVLPAGESVIFTDHSNEFATNWLWEFEGGTPATSHLKYPPPIVYSEPGIYDVKLTVSNAFNNKDSLRKQNYIHVAIPGDTLPTAAFTASHVVVVVGTSVNFYDLSTEHPYFWNWTFQGGQPQNSTVENPFGITYNTVGTFNVQLTVTNWHGSNTVVYEDYITVIPDPGPEAPVAKFSTSNRLIKKGEKVYFYDESDNYPTTWHWSFEQGLPNSANTQLIPHGVEYHTPGYFDVTLNVSNVNGANVLRKKDYIVVYEAFVGKVCDTISNLFAWESPTARPFPGGTGYLGGQNSDQIDAYADLFDHYTFTVINGVIVPVSKLSYTNPNSTIKFIAWDGNDPYPKTELASHEVKLGSLTPNFSQVVMFDQPFEIEGPFYLGYTVNYATNQEFVIGIASNRGVNGKNTLFVRKDSLWYNTKFEYDFSTSTGIKPLVCLVGIEDEKIIQNMDIYPNPANNEIFVEFHNQFKEGDFVEIYDIRGRVLKQKFANSFDNKMSLDISQIPTGIYTVRVFAEGKIFIEKLTVVR